MPHVLSPQPPRSRAHSPPRRNASRSAICSTDTVSSTPSGMKERFEVTSSSISARAMFRTVPSASVVAAIPPVQRP